VHLVGFITKKFVTMHSHMNVKIGAMSAAVSLISPTMCENLIYSFVSFAAW